MDKGRRDLFARYVLESGRLSELENPQSAIVIRGDRIIGTGIKKKIIKSAEYCTSAVVTALFEYIIHRKVYDIAHSEKDILFCSYFPAYFEWNMLYMTAIRTVYYMGEVDDQEAFDFLNTHTKEIPSDGFELIKLNFS